MEGIKRGHKCVNALLCLLKWESKQRLLTQPLNCSLLGGPFALLFLRKGCSWKKHPVNSASVWNSARYQKEIFNSCWGLELFLKAKEAIMVAIKFQNLPLLFSNNFDQCLRRYQTFRVWNSLLQLDNQNVLLLKKMHSLHPFLPHWLCSMGAYKCMLFFLWTGVSVPNNNYISNIKMKATELWKFYF